MTFHLIDVATTENQPTFYAQVEAEDANEAQQVYKHYFPGRCKFLLPNVFTYNEIQKMDLSNVINVGKLVVQKDY
jgi:hypothetical protein